MLYFIPAWYKQNMRCENEQHYTLSQKCGQALQDSRARLLAKFQAFPTQAGHVPFEVLVML